MHIEYHILPSPSHFACLSPGLMRKCIKSFSMTNISSTSPIFYGRLVEEPRLLSKQDLSPALQGIWAPFPNITWVRGRGGEELLVLVEPRKAKAGLKSLLLLPYKTCRKAQENCPTNQKRTEQKWARTHCIFGFDLGKIIFFWKIS